MELMINISEEDYQFLKEGYSHLKIKEHLTDTRDNRCYIAIANGTPLPEECDIQRIIPKRVNVQKWIYTKCPNSNCDYELSTHHGDGYYSIKHKPKFCPNCGQALLWESEV